MANSDSITEWKDIAISHFLGNENILAALDVTEEDVESGLVYSRIFPHLYIPDTVEETSSFINVEVRVPDISDSGVWVYPELIVDVIVHQKRMKLDLPGVSATRADYLSQLIDNELNGSLEFGVGKLVLISNEPGSVNDKFRFRRLTFEAQDINSSMCDEDEEDYG